MRGKDRSVVKGRVIHMTNLLIFKEQLVGFYYRFETYITAALKFLLMLFTFMIINASVGFMDKINNGAIVLVLALLCAFLPMNLIVIITALITTLHLYALSLECAAVAGMVFLIMFVMYFRFSPRDAVAVILTPICFLLKIPYVVPLTLGFVGNPMSCVSVACGVVSYYMLGYVKNNSEQIASSASDPESALSAFKYLIDGMLGSDEMLLLIIVFAVVVVAVFMLKSLPIDYSWKIALALGVVINILIVLVGCSALEVDMSVGGVIVGTLISAIIVFIIQFFIFNVDYSRTESVQFEDDEYYYYVKAIPKITMEAPQVEVKRINPQQMQMDADDLEFMDEYEYEEAPSRRRRNR